MPEISTKCALVEGRAGKTFSRWVSVLLGLAMLSFACAVPGRLYLVAPVILGELRGADAERAELHLSVVSREVPTLFEQQEAGLSRVGYFEFDPVELAVAGREFSKVYRVVLRYRMGTQARVIWRGEFSRRDVVGSIELDCDLDRPARLGQACWVRNPLEHPWLVSTGEDTFNRLCRECHGRSGRRGQANRPSDSAPDLTGIADRRPGGFDRHEVAEWIEGSLVPREHGSRAMPIWGERLSAEHWRYGDADELVGATLDPVVVFLLSIQE